MRLSTDRLPTRVAGTAVGAGFCLFGLWSLLGAGDAVSQFARDRAFWFGVTLLVAGAAAFLASWTVRDVDRIWCRPPRRWWNR